MEEGIVFERENDTMAVAVVVEWLMVSVGER